MDFDLQSKPELTEEQLKSKSEKGDSQYVDEPGKYEFVVESAAYGDSNEKDPDWCSMKVAMQTGDGKIYSFFQQFPKTARNSFLFGEKKSAWELSRLVKFLRSVGVELNFADPMHQIVAVFGKEENLVGKKITATLGHRGNNLKRVDGGFKFVDKDGVAIVETSFPDKDSAKAYAAMNNIKYRAFMDVLEWHASPVNQFEVKAKSKDSPFG